MADTANRLVYRLWMKGQREPTDLAVASWPGTWKHDGIRVQGIDGGRGRRDTMTELVFGAHAEWWDPGVLADDTINVIGAGYGVHDGANWFPLNRIAALFLRNTHTGATPVNVNGHAYRVFIGGGTQSYMDVLAQGYRITTEATERRMDRPTGVTVAEIATRNETMVQFIGYGGELRSHALIGTGPINYPINSPAGAMVHTGELFLPLKNVTAIHRISGDPGAAPELYEPTGGVHEPVPVGSQLA